MQHVPKPNLRKIFKDVIFSSIWTLRQPKIGRIPKVQTDKLGFLDQNIKNLLNKINNFKDLLIWMEVSLRSSTTSTQQTLLLLVLRLDSRLIPNAVQFFSSFYFQDRHFRSICQFSKWFFFLCAERSRNIIIDIRRNIWKKGRLAIAKREYLIFQMQ